METILMIAGITFAAVMIYLLPKYASFIHNQPKLRQEHLRKIEEEKNKDNQEGN